MKLKFLIYSLLIASAISIFALPASAASQSCGSVIGHGIYEAEPDYGEICFTVEVKGENEGKAKDELKTKSDVLIKSVKEYGSVKGESYFSYTDQNGKVVCQRTYVLSTNNTQKLTSAEEKLISAGASSVCPPTYYLKNRTDAEKKALELAISDAKSRAKALGLSGEITSIRDLGTGDHCRYYFLPSVDGKVIIEAKVMLSYKKT